MRDRAQGTNAPVQRQTFAHKFGEALTSLRPRRQLAEGLGRLRCLLRGVPVDVPNYRRPDDCGNPGCENHKARLTEGQAQVWLQRSRHC
jgi:hypothetical protein